MRYTSESTTDPDYNVFYSSDNTTSTSYMPYLSITYSTTTLINNLRIYKTKNDIRVDENGNTPEDLKNLGLSKDELCAMEWINWSDFVGKDASDYRNDWEDLCKLASDEPLESVVLNMIAYFMKGTGGTYSNSTLTTEVRNHEETVAYVNGVKNTFISLVQRYNGDISKLSYPGAYNGVNRENHPMVKAMKDSGCWSPQYGDLEDARSGLGICIDSWWASEIIVDSYSYNNGAYSATLIFNFYDHFGLDAADVSRKYENLVAFGMFSGMRAWYILQHYDVYKGNYKPFITKVSFQVSFSGSI